MAANNAARPLLRLKAAPPAVPPKPKGPASLPRQWLVGRCGIELRAQLPTLLVEVPPVLLLPAEVPLAIGASRELLSLARPDCSKTMVRRWLGRWCRRIDYLAAVAAPDSLRHDLNGQPVEPVADQHRAHAHAMMVIAEAALAARFAEARRAHPQRRKGWVLR